MRISDWSSDVCSSDLLKDFGVAELIDALAAYAPGPRAQPAEPAPISPENNEVTGYVFKVQVNKHSQHSDRIDVLRLCAGTFRLDMKQRPTGRGEPMAVPRPNLFFGTKRELVDEELPGSHFVDHNQTQETKLED